MKYLDGNLLKEIVGRLVEEFHPEQIILFGSHAWGTPTDDSDVDLLVVVSESSEPPTDRSTRALRALGRIMVPLDILVKTKGEIDRYRPVYASLTRQIFERGKVLYGKSELPVRA
jgi:predicted nucleotidyltransferase